DWSSDVCSSDLVDVADFLLWRPLRTSWLMVGMNRLSLAGGLPVWSTTGLWGVARIRTHVRPHRDTGGLVSRSRWPTGHDHPARVLRARWSSLTGSGITGQNDPVGPHQSGPTSVSASAESSVCAQ